MRIIYDVEALFCTLHRPTPFLLYMKSVLNEKKIYIYYMYYNAIIIYYNIVLCACNLSAAACAEDA